MLPGSPRRAQRKTLLRFLRGDGCRGSGGPGSQGEKPGSDSGCRGLGKCGKSGGPVTGSHSVPETVAQAMGV